MQQEASVYFQGGYGQSNIFNFGLRLGLVLGVRVRVSVRVRISVRVRVALWLVFRLSLG